MRLAIVGAGPAGLAAAHALRDAAVAVTVFEKSRGVSGRAATRWRDVPAPDGATARWRYDHGAQYLGPEPDGRAARFVRQHAGDGLTDLAGAVWPFDDAGALRPDDVRADPGPRWTYPDGLAGLGRRLRDGLPDLDLRLETRVARLDRRPDGWALTTSEGEHHDGFDAVLVTAPAPQAAEFLHAGDLDEARLDRLAEALSAVAYRAQFAVVWGFAEPLPRPADVYALVNAGGGHAVAWVAVESDKPGRAPDGCAILIAQMADAWTRERFDADRAAVVAEAAEAVRGLWGPLPEPLWTDSQRWRFSLPDGAVDPHALAAAAELGLFVAGDATAGAGRVHLAIEEGLAAADRIRARL